MRPEILRQRNCLLANGYQVPALWAEEVCRCGRANEIRRDRSMSASRFIANSQSAAAPFPVRGSANSILTCLHPSTKDTKCRITSCTGGGFMQLHTTRINPSEETIKIGPLGIRFLVTGEDSQGSVSVFEVRVPAGQICRQTERRCSAHNGLTRSSIIDRYRIALSVGLRNACLVDPIPVFETLSGRHWGLECDRFAIR